MVQALGKRHARARRDRPAESVGAGGDRHADCHIGFRLRAMRNVQTMSKGSTMNAITKDVTSTINDLIECSKDGEYGFRASAEQIKNPSIKELFLRRAGDCQSAVAELQGLVVQAGEKPEDSGTAMGAIHRGWVATKGKLTGYSDLSVLEEAERGEDKAMETYREALRQELPQSVRSVVERQFEGVKRNHAEVRSLRDQARAAKG
jgi:uncharacterized protein (TIGR02284 family)